MSREQPDTAISIDSWRNRRRVRRLKAAGLFTIDQVADARRMHVAFIFGLDKRERPRWVFDFETYRGLASAPVAGQQTDRDVGGVKRVPVKAPFHHRRRQMSPSFW